MALTSLYTTTASGRPSQLQSAGAKLNNYSEGWSISGATSHFEELDEDEKMPMRERGDLIFFVLCPYFVEISCST